MSKKITPLKIILDDDSDDTEDIISTTKATKITSQNPTSASTFPSAPVQNTISTTLERNSTRLNLLQLYTQKLLHDFLISLVQVPS